MIAIRTNFNKEVGLGHIFRMRILAKELSKKSKLIFFLDKYDELIEKILNYDCEYIYKKGQKFISQNKDALILKDKIKNKSIDSIIIDDYRLNYKWEKVFYKKIPLVVFDDNNYSKHYCDLIVDAKWKGKFTHKRYNKLVNKNTIKLLGPKYSLIDVVKKNKKASFNILFYIGGGGDFKKYIDFLLCLSKKIKIKKIIKLK